MGRSTFSLSYLPVLLIQVGSLVYIENRADEQVTSKQNDTVSTQQTVKGS